MATTIINSHKVESFAKWKQGFDAGESMRAQVGIIIKGVYQSVDDENHITVISEVPNADITRAILTGPGMKANMEKSGIISEPEIKILNQAI
ncbi:MAG: hypothetical protein EOP53_17145 [Sphingobacteriales bacterium]|nr:MAG: hypothetical protein EOP53_17145 [Sphingobacteriales bacterium]